MKNGITKNTIVKADNIFDPFEHLNTFYEYTLKITDDEINQVLFLVKSANTNFQKSTYKSLNVLNFPVLKNLKEQIINILNTHKMFLGINWAQLYNKKDEHGLHNHRPAFYSGIIYLKGKNPSPTIFYSSHLEPYIYNFKRNTLLMFPADIPHEVKPLNKNEERLIISFNTSKHV